MSIGRPYTNPMISPTHIEVRQNNSEGPKWGKCIIYGSAISDANGIATFYITDNGTANGKALLSSIDCVNPSVYSTNGSAIARPRVQMREKNLVGKYVSANVTNLSGVVVLGITVLGSENAMNGQTVEFMVIGDYVT